MVSCVGVGSSVPSQRKVLQAQEQTAEETHLSAITVFTDYAAPLALGVAAIAAFGIGSISFFRTLPVNKLVSLGTGGVLALTALGLAVKKSCAISTSSSKATNRTTIETMSQGLKIKEEEINPKEFQIFV